MYTVIKILDSREEDALEALKLVGYTPLKIEHHGKYTGLFFHWGFDWYSIRDYLNTKYIGSSVYNNTNWDI